ncbi:lipoprotein heptaprenylglyceryl N-acetyltransferase LhaT [Oceanobacillus sp. CAU 1775]
MLKYILLDKKFILLLFLINLFGTIYGYYWYMPQLAITPDIFLIFVPDSPTASLFFTIFLFFFLFNKNTPYIEALALMTLVKYGTWAVVMNLLTLIVEGSLNPAGYMLMASHAGMAIQGVLYSSFYKIKLRHLVVAGIWTLHNDIIDYVYGMMPIYSKLTVYMNEIGYFTFWLSIASIILAYYLTIGRKKINSL